ncbi:MAG: ribosomal methyltransferase Rsm22 [Herbinix sp.]|jgi:ribosomal protein RSM22 (predicted rRNA methylase)|nr:ribosomal methyltransferase Rsm22 [Herbinix sp.]
MELPIELRIAIEEQLIGTNYATLKQDTQTLSKNYRTESGQGKRLLTKDDEAIAYSVVRMPATYGAVHKALEYTLDFVDCKIETLLDIGAGTGAASWAANSLIDLDSIICLERENAMLQIGQKMMKNGSRILNNSKWIKHDLVRDTITEKADLIIASYVLNELDDDNRIKAVDQIWEATSKIAVIVEPGTPTAFSQLKKVREYLLSKGAHMIAPCPHEESCLLPQNDWCHFSCRIQRSKLHRQLKEGDAPYEDEKFMYIAVSREQYRNAEARILRHPIVDKGRITLDVCKEDKIEKMMITKKHELYKEARKAQWGDSIGG